MLRGPAESYHSANHHKYTSGNGLYQRHLRAFLQLVTDRVMATAPRTLLDAGCGEGFGVDFIARQHPAVKITGVDLSEDAVRYAQDHYGERATFRTGSLYALPFSDSAFDTVLCSEVLEHLDDPDRAVSELKRVARNAVVITVPREPYFQWLNNVGQWLGLSPDPEHVNFWTTQGFEVFIKRHFTAPQFATKHIYQLATAAIR